MLQHYANNPAMRLQYLAINGINHAEVWEEEGGYTLALCTRPGAGFVESPAFQTPEECINWLRVTCNVTEEDLKVL